MLLRLQQADVIIYNVVNVLTNTDICAIANTHHEDTKVKVT